MTSRQDSFASLYARYRLGQAIVRQDERVHADRTRRVWLLYAVLILFAIAVAAEALAAVRVVNVLLGMGLASVCATAALALTTGLLASALAGRREARRHRDTASALKSASPVSDATDPDEGVTAWVRRVESILDPVAPPADES